MTEIHYSNSKSITTDQFIDLLVRSSLGERRPINDKAIIDAMIKNASLICTAWKDDLLVGVARSVTDFEYCCYVSDLAVDEAYQKRGIGTGLIEATQQSLGAKCKVILLAAPKAREYYPKLGFERHDSAWVIGSRMLLNSKNEKQNSP